MDGVIADFHNSLSSIMNQYYLICDPIDLIYKARKSIGDRDFIKTDININTTTKEIYEFVKWYLTDNEKFWINLPIIPKSQKLISLIKKYNYYILTAHFDEASKLGKIKWAFKYFQIPEEKMIFEKEKWKYANSNSLLIDDTLEQIEKFVKCGGLTIHHKNMKTTLSTLHSIL